MNSVVFVLTGLESATTCQKSDKLMSAVVGDWNRARSSAADLITVELAINHYSRFAKPPVARRALLLVEPSVTWPSNKISNFHFYDLVFAANSRLGNAIEQAWFNTPTEDNQLNNLPSERDDRFTVVAADKLSLIQGELYSLRRQVVSKFCQEIDVFGPGWDSTRVKRLKKLLGEVLIWLRSGQKISLFGILPYLVEKVPSRGEVKNKFDAYSLNSFALVIENSMELRTEKLYDAIEMGAIPVYVGPDCSDGIPKELFIRCGPNLNEIRAAMDAARKIDKSSWLEIRQKWIESDDFRQSDETRIKAFLDRVAIQVSETF